jgi:predicted DNA-binding transcriptional regulator AlpA
VELPAVFALRLFLNTREVLSLVPFSRKTLQRMVARGKFPPAVMLSTHVRAWRTKDVLEWLNAREATA